MKARKKPIIVFILGPTGVGKSKFAVKLAKGIGGEIISCDSMQVYKDMPIMSQQPTSELRKAVPHHLIGILNPSQEWSAAGFVEKAERITKDIVRRKHIPIIVGGTGLYARAFIKGLFPSPPKDENFRKALYKKAEQKGKGRLYKRLLKTDLLYATKIHPNDLRRIVRALEVYKLTGRPISEKHKENKGVEGGYEILIFILDRARKELYKRINERVEKMFARGIVREIKRLKTRRMTQAAKGVLGYKEVSNYIGGKSSLEEAKEFLKRNTRHYAKRQLSWFRKEKDAVWLELTGRNGAVLINAVARRIKVASRKNKDKSVGRPEHKSQEHR